MADADNNISAAGLPPLLPHGAMASQDQMPRLPHVAFAIPAVPVQRASMNNTGVGGNPPSSIDALLSPDGGSLSSVTNATTPGVAAAATHRTINTQSTMSPGTPDFTKPQSDSNAYLSGDDEDDWDKEAEAVMAAVEVGRLELEEEDANNADDIICREITEMDRQLMLLEQEEAQGGAPEGGGVEEAITEYDTITVTVKTYTAAELKEVAKRVNVAVSGNKSDLFTRIRNSGSNFVVKGDSDESFQYKAEKVPSNDAEVGAAAADAPYWVVLNPEVPTPIPGMDMATGAETGFFGPTNTNNIAGAVRHNFLTHPSEALPRPAFASIDPNRPTQEVGGPSAMAKESIPDFKSARPIDFFNLMITPRFIEKTMVACTNQKASGEGAGVGGTVYTDYVQFDVLEMKRMIGLLFANGLSPKPDITKWFETTRSDPLLGNDFIAPLMDKKLAGGGRVPGIRRWKHFRRFFCLYDPRSAMHNAAKDPLWKIRLLLKQLNKQCMEMWITGKFVSVDEQTIAFKGTSGMKLRISYKKEGDGFQCDAICDRGYTFSFFFRHGDPPILSDSFKDLLLPPTARRVVWLAQRLPNVWTRIYMDNLFNSQKLFSALYQVKALAHGVMRTSGRGFPSSVKQDEEKNANKADQLKGTTKAAVLKNSTDTPDMLAASVYDNKPVHLMSTVSENVLWIQKQRKVWSSSAGEMKTMSYLRLNVIDDYNQHMNSTDISDQLRNTYRPDHWMRNRKWWWAILMWALGVARVNAYKIYCEMWEAEKLQKRQGLPPKWSHREFIQELVLDLMGHSTVDTSRKRKRSSNTNLDGDEQSRQSSSCSTRRSSCSTQRSTARSSSSNNNSRRGSSASCSTASSNNGNTRGASVHSTARGNDEDDDDDDDFECESGIKEALKKHTPYSITTKRMESSFFSSRLDGRHHPTLPTESYCQYCRYQFLHVIDEESRSDNKLMEQNRKHVRRCLVCNVNLCSSCDLEFHGINTKDLGTYFKGR